MMKSAFALLMLLTMAGGAVAADNCPAFLNQDFHKLRSSETVNICKAYVGKPLLIVNTASHCGFTPQFKGLEELHEKYQDRGLVVLGFPSDDFNQEDPDENKTADICYLNYGVKFTMLQVSHVKGADANAVFKVLNKRSSEPSWNFNKYLLSADGQQLTHYGSRTTPDSPELTQAIEAVLPNK
jgi:glutathione peroxidase